MRAVDTNVLVYAHITSSRHHEKARVLLLELAEGALPWALPWPCIYEFLRVVTHPRVYHPSVPPDVAVAGIRAILASPSLLLLSETPGHAKVMADVIGAAGVSGNLMHDAHIAALCFENVSGFSAGVGFLHRFACRFRRHVGSRLAVAALDQPRPVLRDQEVQILLLRAFEIAAAEHQTVIVGVAARLHQCKRALESII